MSQVRIAIAPRFRRAAQLESDVRNGDSLNGYVVSPLARDAALHLTREVASEDGGRAFSIIGPYGSGKSSFLTFLLRLWRWSGDATERLRLGSEEAKMSADAALATMDGPLVPVVATGERGPLALTILRALERAGQDHWAASRRSPEVIEQIASARVRLEQGDLVPDSHVVELTLVLAERIAKSTLRSESPPIGLVLVVDEMGKHLEFAALNPHRTDLYLLQLLAERAARMTTGRVAIITVLHQEMSAYAEALPRSAREEWTKVGGRFETVPYLESPRHLTSLIAGALELEPALRRGAAYDAALQTAARVKTLLPNSLADTPLAECFPLDPVAALVVGPLFRRKVAQNERSLFAFLASFEPGGFQDWLTRADLQDREHGLFRLPDLYDYIMASLGVRGAADPGDRTWASAEHALSRLPADAPALDAKTVKAVALLSLLGPSVGLRADLPLLALTTGCPDADVSAALDRLAASSILIFRRFKAAWQLWDGSDLDVGAIVERTRMRVEARGGLAELLGKHVPPPVVVAVRHGYRTGSLRTLVGRFVSAPPPGPTTRTSDGDGDGELLLLLPDRAEDLGDIERRLLAGELAPPEIPVVYAVPERLTELRDGALLFFAIHEALTSTPELDGDPVARRELTERRQAALDHLGALVATSYAKRWIWRSEATDVAGRPGLAASRIFDDAYRCSPCIRNELVNRDELSSAAAAARRDLMERMLDHVGIARLGIEGHPPALSIYRSVLESTGLHQPMEPENPGAEWTIGAPPAGSDLEHTWKRIEELVRRSPAGRANFAALAAGLARPPFGVRAGVAPILILAWARSRADETFWYEENSFVPSVTTDLVHRLLRKPEHFEVQLSGTDGALTVVVAALARHTVRGIGPDTAKAPIRVIRSLVRMVSALSPYALATQRVSARARRVRSSLKTARDPVRLLLEGLPEALDLQAFTGAGDTSKKVAEKFARALTSTLNELASAEDALLSSLEGTLCRLLGGSAPSEDLRTDLATRAQALLASSLDLPPLTRRIAELTAELAPKDEESRRIWLHAMGTALLGKAPGQWVDSDLERFNLAATEPCRSFLAAEQLALELGSAGKAAVRLVRVSLLDNRGERRVGVGVLHAGEEAKVRLFEAEVSKRATELGLTTPGLVYAVLSGMMASMDGTSVQVIKLEGVSDVDPHR